MSDDSHGEELENLDDALFGDGTAKPAPVREPSPSSDIDWFAGLDDPSAQPSTAGTAGAAAGAAAADLTSELMPELPPAPAPTPDSSPDSASYLSAEGPIVDAAIFGMAGEPTPQPLSRRELHARPPADRRRRVLTFVLVVGLVALVGIGVAAVVTGGGEGSVAKSQVKVVGTALPTTTASTRPVTTLPPATIAPTTPPATAAVVANSGGNTTPARTNPPVVATDPPPTEPPTTTPPTTTPPTTTPPIQLPCTTDCVGPPPP